MLITLATFFSMHYTKRNGSLTASSKVPVHSYDNVTLSKVTKLLENKAISTVT